MGSRVEIIDSVKSIRLPVAWEEGEAIDRKLLVLYCDGDADEARKLVS